MNDDLTPDTTHSTEIDHGHAEYSVEELLEQCQGNAASLLLATLSVLAEQGISVDAWAAGVAQIFARSWEREELWTAGEYLDALLTNFRSLGATVAAAYLGETEATAAIENYPDEELARMLGVDPAFVEAMFHVGVHLAGLWGLRLRWRREGVRVDLDVVAASFDE